MNDSKESEVRRRGENRKKIDRGKKNKYLQLVGQAKNTGHSMFKLDYK